MILTNKFIFLLSVAASAFAAPLLGNDATQYEERDIVNLESRAGRGIPDSVTCGTVTFPKASIIDALMASYTPAKSNPSSNNPQGKTYPDYFGNKNGRDKNGKDIKVLSFAAARTAENAGALMEQPIVQGRTWKGGNQGKYRVIYDGTETDLERSYIGVVYHVDATKLGRCTEVVAPACPAPTTRTRKVWDMLRRAAGRKPTKPKTKAPANCKKPTKKPTKPTKKPTKPTKPKPTKPKTPKKKPTKPKTKAPKKKPTKPKTKAPKKAKKGKKSGRF